MTTGLICPDCGAENADDADYCTRCARSLEDVRVYPKDEESDSILEGWEPERENYNTPYRLTIAPVPALLLKIIIGIFVMLAGALILVVVAREEPGALDPAMRLIAWGTILLASTLFPIYTAWRGQLPSFLKKTIICVYDSPPLLEGRGMPLSQIAFPIAGAYLLGLMLWYHTEITDTLTGLTILAILVISALSLIFVTTGRIELRSDGMHARQGFNPAREYWVPYENISSIDVRWRIVSVKLRGVPKRFINRFYFLRSDPERFRTEMVRALQTRLHSGDS